LFKRLILKTPSETTLFFAKRAVLEVNFKKTPSQTALFCGSLLDETNDQFEIK
jgi:hypothetical protein